MIPTEGDLRRRRDCHVWTKADWATRDVSLPLAKNWRWLRSVGGGGSGGEAAEHGQVHAYLAKGEGVIDRFSLCDGDLSRAGTMLLPSGPG